MKRPPTSLQSALAGVVWQLSDQRAALLKQVAEIEAYQHDAIALAEQHGVRQTVLAELAGVSRQRISQIVAETEIPTQNVTELQSLWSHALEWSDDQLKRLASVTTDTERDTWNARFELVHGRPGTLGVATPPHEPSH